MNRRSFLSSVVAAVPGVSLASTLSAASESEAPPLEPFGVSRGRDRAEAPIALYEGDTFYTKVSSKDTHGSLYIYESTRQRKGGPAQHFHFDQDEWILVLEGEIVVKVGEQTFQCGPGDSVFAPRRIPHVWAKTSEGVAKMLIVFQPAGKMEAYFQAVSEGRVAKMTPERQEAFRREHGFQRVGPALFHQKE